MNRSAHEANRKSWNAATPVHNSHKREQAAWLAAGGSTLFDEELRLLGELRGQRLVHLQCNSGQDTLSLAQRGAVVTGVDISDTAIDTARQLAADSGIPATFARADLLDWFAQTEPHQFDVAFCSYGFIGWISALAPWAAGIARVLAPGGRLVMIEFHPTAFIFDEQWRHAWPYSTAGEALVMPEGVHDYVGRSGPQLAPSGFLEGVTEFVNPHPTHEFAWGIGDVLGALLGAGLKVAHYEEYLYANGWKGWEEMTALPGNRWTVPEGRPNIPLMYAVVASR